jgi:hypothetical protein
VSADAFDAQLNALDMLAVGAQVARGDAPSVLSPLGVSIPGVGTRHEPAADRRGAAHRGGGARALDTQRGMEHQRAHRTGAAGDEL